MDRIFIEELVVFAQIGVYDWEQQIKQKLVFDLEMAWDCQKAAETDDVQYCLNYAEVSQFILDYVQAKPFLLIEASWLMKWQSNYNNVWISWLRLKLSKPKAVAQSKSCRNY